MTGCRSVIGGLLVQEKDGPGSKSRNDMVLPTAHRRRNESHAFGWRVVKHVKSNAIVYASKDRPLAWRGPDGASGCGANRGLEGERGRTYAQRQRRLQRRILPFADG